MAEQQLELALRRWGLSHLPLERLAGDVSHRRYYRLTAPDLEGGSAVVMVTPAEEAAKMHDWMAIGEYLHRHGVPVPRVLRRDDERCVLLVSDVGDQLLTGVTDPVEAEDWYRAVLGDLARVEREADGEPARSSPAHRRRLEDQRIRWELRRFRKVVAAPVMDLGDAELALWKSGEDNLADVLTAAPRAWMHRDLHARNLLVRAGRVWWIDYQDAMMGPWLYDLASLLLDPYAALPPARQAALRDWYLARPGRVHVEQDHRRIQELYAVCAVQRLIHCIACYVWVCDQLGRDTYVRYLPFAMDQLRDALERCGPAQPLAGVLDRRWDGMRERWCRDAVAV